MLERLVLASGNPGKIAEFSQALAPFGIRLIPQGELGVAEAAEPHLTFVENALAKARHASATTGMPALADDSGICAHALGGAPGIYSARFASMAGGAGGDAANNAHLLAQLAAHQDRRASYVAALVLVRSPKDPIPIISMGFWHGEIVATPAGENGFGYDPHFYLPELGCTAAELDLATKNRFSHRAQALAHLSAALATVVQP